jgi:hypothetical protein
MADEPTNQKLDERLTNIERVVLSIQAQMTPKWLRMGAWGALLGAALKEFLSK